MCSPTSKVNSSKICIICSEQETLSSDETGSRSKGLSQRFCTLIGRYLQSSVNVNDVPVPNPPINLLESHTVCVDCCSIASSFCDIFQDFSSLQLQLNIRILEISELMRKAEELQNQNQERVKDLSGGIFRQEFLNWVRRNSRGFPLGSIDKSECETKMKSAEIGKVQSESQVTQSEVEIMEVIDIDIEENESRVHISTPSNPQPKPDEAQVQLQEVEERPNSSFQTPVPIKRSERRFECGICHGRFTEWTSCKFHQVAIHKTKNAVVIKVGKRDPGSGPVAATTSGSRSGLNGTIPTIVGGLGAGAMTTKSVTVTPTPEQEAQSLTEFNVPACRPSSQSASQNVNTTMNPGKKCRHSPNQFQNPKTKTSSNENANAPTVNANAISSQCQNSSNNDVDSFISNLINKHDGNAAVTMATSTSSTATGTNQDTQNFSQPMEITKSHKCKFCPRTFLTLYKLKVHQRVHTKEKPYACAICGNKFSYWSNCYAHQKTVHKMAKANIISELQQAPKSNGFQGQRNETENQHRIIYKRSKRQDPGAPKLYHCKVCGNGFNHLQNIYRHQRKVHGLTEEVLADFRKWKPPTVGSSVPKVAPVPKANPISFPANIPRQQQNPNENATFNFSNKQKEAQLIGDIRSPNNHRGANDHEGVEIIELD